jgi:hypothetical protein
MNLMNRFNLCLMAGVLLAGATGCSDEGVLNPADEPELTAAAAPSFAQVVNSQGDDQACWGQATRVFAAMGVMGEHASQYETPRLGLRNLARALYEIGAIADDSMQALGAFVATAEQLSIDACM